MHDLAQIRVIIYDCDGVLIDSSRANQAFYNHILACFGQPPLTPEQWDCIKPLAAADALTWLLQDTPWLAAAQEYQKTVDNTPFLPLIRAEPDLQETLTRLRPHYRLAIATNRGKSLLPVLKHCGLGEFFEFTVSSLDVVNPKPHPECIHRILHHFEVQPGQACYIGDSDLDREVSARAKVLFIAYQNLSLKADIHLQNHLDLWRLLRGELDSSNQ
jgi:phosphoglycolate phosphatase|uniref:phosphoglycolate phosphatase n=1 Tax=Desulfobacca acetoxidans TaxID=60893 RepID=A0A7V6DQ94_9BACT